MNQSQRMAICGMTAALGVVIMLVGAIADLGMYASPMFAGLCLLPIGQKFGKKYQLMIWLAISALSFMLVPNIEENLMFFALFGFYPILYPSFSKLGKLPRIIAKLLFFNVVAISLEALVMLVLVPESLGSIFTIILLVLGNLTFIVYDLLIPRMELILTRILERIQKSKR